MKDKIRRFVASAVVILVAILVFSDVVDTLWDRIEAIESRLNEQTAAINKLTEFINENFINEN